MICRGWYERPTDGIRLSIHLKVFAIDERKTCIFIKKDVEDFPRHWERVSLKIGSIGPVVMASGRFFPASQGWLRKTFSQNSNFLLARHTSPVVTAARSQHEGSSSPTTTDHFTECASPIAFESF